MHGAGTYGAKVQTAAERGGNLCDSDWVEKEVDVPGPTATPTPPPPTPTPTPPPTPALELSNNRVAGTAGQPINSRLSTASGGTTPYTYSIVGSLPTGLSFSSSTRRITGATQVVSTTQVTYRVTDGDGTIEDATLSIAIAAATLPDLSPVLPDLPGRSALELVAITPITLPEATGGDGSLRYSTSGLPPGLSFNTGNRQITGNPGEVDHSQDYTVTYTVTDSDGDQDSETFRFRIENDTGPTFPDNIGPYSKEGLGSITATLPAASGGNSPLTYSAQAIDSSSTGRITSFNASTRAIVVYVGSVPQTFRVRYKVTDDDKDFESRTITFRTTPTVVVEPMPVDLPLAAPAVVHTRPNSTDSMILYWVVIGDDVTYLIQQRERGDSEWVTMTLSSPNVELYQSPHQEDLGYAVLLRGITPNRDYEQRVKSVRGQDVSTNWSSVRKTHTPPPFIGLQSDHIVQYILGPSGPDPGMLFRDARNMALNAWNLGLSGVGFCESGRCSSLHDDGRTVTIKAPASGNGCGSDYACVLDASGGTTYTDSHGHMNNLQLVIEQPAIPSQREGDRYGVGEYIWTNNFADHDDEVPGHPSQKFAYLPDTFMHELGHALGLDDLYKYSGYGNFLMGAQPPRAFETLPQADIQYVQEIYRNHPSHR